jgi:hypothetical protein
MNDLEAIFARDPKKLNTDGTVGYTERELDQIIQFYREYRAKSLAPKPMKEKRMPGAKLPDLDDLDV